MRAYPQFTREFVLFELDMAEAWIWRNVAIETDPMISAQRASPGYVAQEIENRLNGK